MASAAARHVADTNVCLAGLCIPCRLTSRAFTFVTLQLLLVTALWACAACNVFTSHLFHVLLPMTAGPQKNYLLFHSFFQRNIPKSAIFPI